MKIRNTVELLTREGQLRLNNTSIKELKVMFQNESYEVKYFDNTTGSGGGERLIIKGFPINEKFKIIDGSHSNYRIRGKIKMKYEYKGIYLEEPIEDIIEKLDTSNTTFKRETFTLEYKPYDYIRIYIHLEVGEILYIVVLDKNYQIDENLKMGVKLTKDLIEKYELYYDDFEEAYLSYKYKELGIETDFEDNIIGISFDKQEKLYDLSKTFIENYLECKNLKDIYKILYDNYTLDANIEKREIYGQIDNYKFTFDMLTRDIKSIQNLETGESIKTALEK